MKTLTIALLIPTAIFLGACSTSPAPTERTATRPASICPTEKKGCDYVPGAGDRISPVRR